MAGVYIHIPYCEARCFYCDFYTSGNKKTVPDEYINALIRDIKKAQIKTPPQTVYFGGGTPSLLNERQINALINALSPQSNAEITLEANPGTVDYEKLTALKKAGVNRLSLGIQTANNESLKLLGRAHTAKQSMQILQMAHKAGFENISCDIMLNLPNYTQKELHESIELIKNSTHISAYILKIEQNTVFGKKPPENLPSDEQAADFYLQCVEMLKKHNFNQYEISNFAKKNYEGKHNLLYWNCEDYFAFGPAAHGCINGERFYTPKNIQKYIEKEQDYVFEGTVDYNDYIMLRLRLNEGLNFNTLKKRFNYTLTKKQADFCRLLVKNDMAVYTEHELKLTPKGMLMQNSILCDFL